MKNRISKLGAVLLALVMVLTLAPMTVFAARAPRSNEMVVQSRHECGSKDETDNFLYSDDYFRGNGYTYNHDLATASLGMNLAGSSSHDAQNEGNRAKETQNWEAYATQCGFKAPKGNHWMHEQAIADSCGVTAAYKKLKDAKGDSTLVALAFRGFAYNAEWGGNVNIGASGEHRGFALARDEGLKFLKQYIEEENIKGRVKLWISGYSRAAIAANMTGGAIDNGFDLGKDVTFAPEDLYCYCFEPPLGATQEEVQDKKYDNIHNIVNPTDVVCYVAFRDWGFTRYGVDHYIPVKTDANYDKYKAAFEEQLKTVNNDPGDLLDRYWADDFVAYDYNNGIVTRNGKSQKEFYADLSKAICTSFTTSRQDYADNLEAPLIALLEDIFRNPKSAELTDVLPIVLQKIQQNWQTVAGSLLNNTFKDVMGSYIAESMQQLGLQKYDYATVDKMLGEFQTRGSRMLKEYPGTTITLLRNIYFLVTSHFQATEQAWMWATPADFMTKNTGYSYNL